MTSIREIFDSIDGAESEIIRLQEELTSRVALGPDNGGTGEHSKAAYIKERLLELGPDSLEEIKAPDPRAEGGYRPNLVARWEGRRKAPAVWVLSHMDIVPPGDFSLWEGDPYKMRVEGDRIIGRGVEDNQHAIVSSLLAMKAILGRGHGPEVPVCLGMVADEETGSKYGLDHLLKNRRDLFDPGDMIIVPDGGNEQGTMIEIAEKSMFWLKFIVSGSQCHGSTPEKGRNTLSGSARLILALEKVKKVFDLRNDLFRPPHSTFEPTKMEANVPNVNTIPGRNVFYVDGRILPEYRLDDVFRCAREISDEVAKEHDLSIEMETYYRQDATEPTSADAPVVKALTRAIKEVTGLDAEPMGIGGGTVAAFFRRAGFPVAVWLTQSKSAHQPNEYCLISNVMRDAKVFATLFMGG